MSSRATVIDKLTTIKNHLSPPPQQPSPTPGPPNTSSSSQTTTTTTSTMASARPPITCHVLDTTIGLPAQGIPVKLYPVSTDGSASSSSSSANAYKGTTNHDGRVTEWTGPQGQTSLTQVFEGDSPRDLLWTLEFETAAYWQGKGVETPFFPRVSLQFVTESFSKSPKGADAHWHVPLLLGPYNYTTYRGS